MRKKLLNLLIGLSIFTSNATAQSEDSSSLKLWYSSPANSSIKDDISTYKDDAEWLKALPLGNGALGVMVFGDVNKERIQLSEETMWSGSPDDNDNPDAFNSLAEIRSLLFQGKYKEATELTNKTQICIGSGSGKGQGYKVPFGSFQTLGDLWLDFNKNEPYTNYHRELDLNDAMVRVSYTQGGVKFKREIFTSAPDQVMVANFTADKKGKVSFSCGMDRPERFTTFSEGDQLVLTGALSNGKGGDGLQYMARLKAVAKNGTVVSKDGKLTISNADEVTLYLSASTDYKLEYPIYKGRDYKTITKSNIEKASEKAYSILLNEHIADYQNYFKRVAFDITNGEKDLIPTDERLMAFKDSRKSDKHLAELMFQYGRYLIISSSRPGTMPANLQGIWSNKIKTAWNGDYHTNINLQMNYWPVESTNLPEMHLPLFDLIESLVEPGSKTAKTHYHADGWVVHPITNVWGYTSPGEAASWGMHTGAGAWICQHIGEHYAFTGDKDFLKRMYPTLKSSVEFSLSWLVTDPKTGLLVSGPAASPENSFITPDGNKSQISMGPTHDQQVIWSLFDDFLKASKELGIANEFVTNVANAQKQLLGYKIGEDGRLMEWASPFEEADAGHRHMSHLFALHPGSQINVLETPELAEAAKKSLNFRLSNGGGHTGWSAAWLISLYARLLDAEKALENVDRVFLKSTNPNLFGSHPPFQMDANFGFTAGVSEMLLQSYKGIIQLLPALPEEWSKGNVNGLVARGGFEINMNWSNGSLKGASITSGHGNSCVLQTKVELEVKNVKTEVSKVTVNNQVYFRTSFNTEIGDTYEILVK
ncbi:glycoside hydrolase family 95 protein [uncultured Arcticibacterium sp.]|uniref:glycoside hydrolase family 95 protein n=1 Tax=uncultured Arcticibacterium sp. TaxID=2173042 RepID=UPI0030FA70D2